MSVTRLSELLAEARRHKDLEVRSAVLADLAIEAEALLLNASHVCLEQLGTGAVLVCQGCDGTLGAGTLGHSVFSLMRSAMAHQCHVDQ